MAKKSIIDRMLIRLNLKKDLTAEFITHQYFKNMNYWRNIQIHSLVIESPAKKRVMILFLNIKFKSFEEAIYNFVNLPDCLDRLEEIEGIVIEAIKEYEAAARFAGIPEVFIAKFNEWHMSTISDTVELLRTILQSNSHSDKFSKLIAILDILTFAFRKTIIHAEQTANSLNGQLEAALKGTQFDL